MILFLFLFSQKLAPSLRLITLHFGWEMRNRYSGTPSIKVTVDLQGCLQENQSYSCCLGENHKKIYITAKLIKCRIRRNTFFLRFDLMVSMLKPELPAFLCAGTTKQTAHCQSVGDKLQNYMRLF